MKQKILNSQKFRFVIVGGTNTAIDFGLLFILKALGIPEITSNTVSTGIAFVFSFFANKKYTFKSGGDTKKQMVLFTLVTLFGLWVIQNSIIELLKPIVFPVVQNDDLTLLISKVIATVASLIWNYILYAKIVFPEARDKKRLVIDTRVIESSTGRYMQRLLENINDHHQDKYEYIALVPSKVVDKWQARLPHIKITASDYQAYKLGEQFGLFWQLCRLKPDLTHFTMPQQPFLWFGKSITTIHDTTLIRFDNIDGNWFIYKLQKFIFIILVKLVMRRSKVIIAPTEFVRQDLADYFGRRFLGKITVTLEAGNIPDAEPEPIKSLQTKDFIFFVGNAFPYKNVKRIILAMEKLSTKYPKLILALAGKNDYFYNELEDYCIKHNIKNVKFLGFISDGEKRWALQNTKALVTASLSEGFCIPLLEAMVEGAPVVASNISCLPEVTGDAALLFDPYSTDDLADKLSMLLDSKQLALKLSRKGLKRIKKFSWQKMADETIEAYQAVFKN